MQKRQSSFSYSRRLWPLLLVFLGFALRLYGLDAQSFWFDEGWSWHLASMPLRQMAEVTAGDRNPVLYYTLLHGWLNIAGDSEFVQRYLSLLPDGLTIALAWVLGQRLAALHSSQAPSRPTVLGLLPPLLYVLCPFAFWYAQETRMYAQMAMLCTASSYLLLRWLDISAQSRRWLIGATLGLLAAMHTHYYAIFLLPAQGLVVLSWNVHRLRGRPPAQALLQALRPSLLWLMSALLTLALVLPWLLFAQGGFAYNDGFYFPLNTVDGRMLEWLRAFVSGGFGYPLPEWWPILWVGLAALALIRTWRNPRLLFALALAVLPVFFATLAVRWVYPNRSVFHPRYLIYVAPMLCVWLAGGLTVGPGQPAPRSHPSRRVAHFAVSLLTSPLFALAIFALWLPAFKWHYTQPPLIRDDTRGAVRHVVEAIEPGDVVIMSRDDYAIRYYWPKITAQVGKQAPLLAAPEGLHGVLRDDALLIEQLNANRAKRVRLMLWQDDVVDPQKLIESTLWRNGYQIGEYNFGRIRLPLYQITEPHIQPLQGQPVDLVFGDQLKLQAAWQLPQATAGNWFYVVLWWQALRPLPKDYKVFIHVEAGDETGAPKFQDDRLQLNDLLPMTRWVVGETLRAPHAMVTPADLPAGQYRVFVGVYDPLSGERLKLADGRDQLELTKLTIVRH